MYQYRIRVNDAWHIYEEYPKEKWENLVEVSEYRGGFNAKLERRLITDDSILTTIENEKGYIKIRNNQLICPWEFVAEIKD